MKQFCRLLLIACFLLESYAAAAAPKCFLSAPEISGRFTTEALAPAVVEMRMSVASLPHERVNQTIRTLIERGDAVALHFERTRLDDYFGKSYDALESNILADRLLQGFRWRPEILKKAQINLEGQLEDKRFIRELWKNLDLLSQIVSYSPYLRTLRTRRFVGLLGNHHDFATGHFLAHAGGSSIYFPLALPSLVRETVDEKSRMRTDFTYLLEHMDFLLRSREEEFLGPRIEVGQEIARTEEAWTAVTILKGKFYLSQLKDIFQSARHLNGAQLTERLTAYASLNCFHHLGFGAGFVEKFHLKGKSSNRYIKMFKRLPGILREDPARQYYVDIGLDLQDEYHVFVDREPSRTPFNMKQKKHTRVQDDGSNQRPAYPGKQAPVLSRSLSAA